MSLFAGYICGKEIYLHVIQYFNCFRSDYKMGLCLELEL